MNTRLLGLHLGLLKSASAQQLPLGGRIMSYDTAKQQMQALGDKQRAQYMRTLSVTPKPTTSAIKAPTIAQSMDQPAGVNVPEQATVSPGFLSGGAMSLEAADEYLKNYVAPEQRDTVRQQRYEAQNQQNIERQRQEALKRQQAEMANIASKYAVNK